MTGHGRRENGSVAVELVLVAPVMLVVLLLVVGLGRMAHARQDVDGAAADAARAASLERNTYLSEAAARDTATATLAGRGISCQGLQVTADVSAYEPGGSVAVTVTCTAGLADVALSGLPGHKTFTATAVVPIEQYRAANQP